MNKLNHLKINGFFVVMITMIASPIVNVKAQDNLSPPPTNLSTSLNKNSPVTEPVLTGKAAQQKPKLNLMDVYELSLFNDPKLKQAQQQAISAEEEITQARSGFLPQFSYNANVGVIDNDNEQGDIGAGGADFDDAYESQSAGLALDQTVFNREIGSRLDSAKISSELSKTEQDIVLQKLQLDTSIAYLTLLRNQDRLDAAEKQLASTEEQYTQAKDRYDVGVGTITDFYQAESRLSLAQSEIVVSRNEVADAQQSLLALTGVLISDLYPLSSDYPVIPPMPNDLSYWLNLSMTNNLSLLLARQTTELSDEQIDLAKAEYWPSLNIVADQTWNHINESDGLDGENNTGRVFLQLQGKLYQGGRLRSQLKQAEVDHLASLYSYDDIERMVREGTTNSFNDVQTSIRQVQALKIAYLSAEKTLRAREQTYQVGLSTNLEVLDAIRDWFEARNNFLAARYQHAVNLLVLKLQAGTLNVNDLQDLNRWVRLTAEGKQNDSEMNMNAEIKKMDQTLINEANKK